MIKQRFFGIPLPEEVEAPSSWFPRAASSQGEPLGEFAKMLGFNNRADIDRQFVAIAPRHIAQVCGLPVQSFDFVHRLLEQARDLKMSHPVLLTYRNRPRYRFCPMCLKTQRTPYLPVHWRFDAWRMCYHHMCMMEDKCGHCHMSVVPQRDMMQAGRDKKGVAFMSQCLHCSKLLWQVEPLSIHSFQAKVLSPRDRQRIANGNAFLAALAHEQVRIPGIPVTTPQIGLPLAERQGLLASGTYLTADAVRKRHGAFVEELEAKRCADERVFRECKVPFHENPTRIRSSS